MDTTSLLPKIKALAKAYLPEATAHRRHLHVHPELSFQEHETSAYVIKTLRSYGIDRIETMAGTGVVAVLQGELESEGSSNQCLALRADLDALPIQEIEGRAYGSQNQGVMHACGHDVHTTSLLIAARILQETRSDWRETIKLIFQPGEEVLPGGASLLIEEGVLKAGPQGPAPRSIFGQHVFPALEVGKVGFRQGRYMASTDEILLTIKGKGGHGAMPHTTLDPVYMAAQLIVTLQNIVSRRANPTIPTVLSFGGVTAEGTYNVIPSEVVLKGTLRTHDEAWRESARTLITEQSLAIVAALGGHCEVLIRPGYPALFNNPELTARAKANAEAYLGTENVVDLDLYMTGEDFAGYTQHIPGCFYRLGTRDGAAGIIHSVHTSQFDIPESALEIGAGLMAWQAVSELAALDLVKRSA